MYMQTDIATSATRVFHMEEPRIDPAARRAEIEQVIALATSAIPKGQMRKLGTLSFAPARDDDDHSYFGQIRSEPIGSSGLEFRFPISARGTGDRDIVTIAAELADFAQRISRRTSGLKKLAAIVREIADEALKPAQGGIAEMRLVAIGATPGYTAEQFKMTVDVEMLGDDLTAGIERVCEATMSDGLDRLEERLRELAAKHVKRRQILAEAKVAGASGWIDDSALRVLELSGLGRRAGVDVLRLDRQVDLHFGGENGYDVKGGVYWDDGVVRGYVENRDREKTYRLEAKVLTLKSDVLPSTVAACLVGRHLGEVLEFDYVPANALIVEVRESGDWLYLQLEIGRSPIEQAIAG